MGCLKLQVFFRKKATNYRALLRKMTYEDKASYDSTPLCSELTYGNSCGLTFENVRAGGRHSQQSERADFGRCLPVAFWQRNARNDTRGYGGCDVSRVRLDIERKLLQSRDCGDGVRALSQLQQVERRVCCSVLQCVAVCCSVLQCAAVGCSDCGDGARALPHLQQVERLVR